MRLSTRRLGGWRRRGRIPRLIRCVVAATAAVTACSGPVNLRQAPLEEGDGITVSRAAPEVLPVARQAVLEAGFEVEEVARGEAGTWLIYGQRVLTEREVAAHVRVVVREVGEGETAVRVLVRRTVPAEFQVGGDEYTDRILSWIAARLLDAPGREPDASVDPGESGGIS